MKRVILPILFCASAIGAAFGVFGTGQTTSNAAARLAPDGLKPDPRHLAAYLDCAAQAERRRLSHYEATECLDHYLRLKLSFLPNMTVDTYMQLDPARHWEVNQRGYAAYVAWRAGTEAAK